MNSPEIKKRAVGESVYSIKNGYVRVDSFFNYLATVRQSYHLKGTSMKMSR